MTHGLYDQIGAHHQADPDTLRAAYSRALARLARRRRDLLDQRGDTARLDLLRTQVEQAWEILSDPARRRRHDALLALGEHGGVPKATEVWERASGVLTSPGAAAAVELLRVATRLQLPDLLPVPGGPADDEEPTVSHDTQADVPTEALPSVDKVARPMPEVPPAQVIPHPLVADPDQGRSAASLPTAEPKATGPAIVMPSPSFSSSPREPSPAPSFGERRASNVTTSPETVQQWIEEHGWSGALIRTAREARGMSLRDVGDATKISARYLEAIEADDFGQLPSSTFVKGYLREIARLLDLAESELISGYLRRIT